MKYVSRLIVYIKIMESIAVDRMRWNDETINSRLPSACEKLRLIYQNTSPMIILGHIRVCQSKTKSCSHFRQLSITFFFVKRRPRELKTRSAVLAVAITQRYFLASLAKWGNLFSFFFQKWRGLPAFEIFGSFLYFDISSMISCFELLPHHVSGGFKTMCYTHLG